MNPELASRYVALDAEARDLKAKLKAVEADRDALEQPLIDDMLMSGFTKVALDSGETLSIGEDVFPKMREGMTRDDVIKALRLVAPVLLEENFNGNKFNALVREYDRAGEALPEALASVVQVSKTPKISIRRS